MPPGRGRGRTVHCHPDLGGIDPRLEPRECERAGTASGKPITVRALAWVMAGHPRHHVEILRERYGVR